MEATMTEEGLLISKEYIKRFGEIALMEQKDYIIIKPKSLTRKLKGRLKIAGKDIDRIIEEGAFYGTKAE